MPGGCGVSPLWRWGRKPRSRVGRGCGAVRRGCGDAPRSRGPLGGGTAARPPSPPGSRRRRPPATSAGVSWPGATSRRRPGSVAAIDSSPDFDIGIPPAAGMFGGPSCAGDRPPRDAHCPAWVRARFPGLHLLHTAFSFGFPFFFFPPPYSFQKRIPSSPSKTKTGMDRDSSTPRPGRAAAPAVQGRCRDGRPRSAQPPRLHAAPGVVARVPPPAPVSEAGIPVTNSK